MASTALGRTGGSVSALATCYRCPVVHSLPVQASSSSTHGNIRRPHSSSTGPQRWSQRDEDHETPSSASAVGTPRSPVRAGINLDDEVPLRRRPFVQPSHRADSLRQHVRTVERIHRYGDHTSNWQRGEGQLKPTQFAPRPGAFVWQGDQSGEGMQSRQGRNRDHNAFEHRSTRFKRESTFPAMTAESGAREARQDKSDEGSQDHQSRPSFRNPLVQRKKPQHTRSPRVPQYELDPDLDLSKLPKMPDEEKRPKIGWSGVSFDDMLPRLTKPGGFAKGSGNFLIKAAFVDSLPVPRPPPFPPHLLRKRTEDKVVKFGFMATIAVVSKKACVRRRAMRRLKSAINLVVKRDIGVPPGEKGYDLVLPELAYLATVNRKALEAPIEELAAEAASALIAIRHMAQTRPIHPRKQLPKWKTE